MIFCVSHSYLIYHLHAFLCPPSGKCFDPSGPPHGGWGWGGRGGGGGGKRVAALHHLPEGSRCIPDSSAFKSVLTCMPTRMFMIKTQEWPL